MTTHFLVDVASIKLPDIDPDFSFGPAAALWPIINGIFALATLILILAMILAFVALATGIFGTRASELAAAHIWKVVFAAIGAASVTSILTWVMNISWF